MQTTADYAKDTDFFTIQKWADESAETGNTVYRASDSGESEIIFACTPIEMEALKEDLESDHRALPGEDDSDANCTAFWSRLETLIQRHEIEIR